MDHFEDRLEISTLGPRPETPGQLSPGDVAAILEFLKLLADWEEGSRE